MITIELEHHAETEIVQGSNPADPGAPAPATVWHLARLEGPRLLRHPAFLAGCLVTAAYFLAADLPNDLYYALVGGAAAGPALGALLAANAAELRSRTSGGDELLHSIPLGPQARTTGMLVALLWPVLATVVVTAALGLVSGAIDGSPVALVGETVDRTPTPIEWMQGPAVVAYAGALGILLARLVPSRLLAVLVALVSGVLLVPMFFWGPSEHVLWFTPLVNHGDRFSWVQVTPSAGYTVLDGFHVGRLGWHVVYLVGVALLLSGAALLRYGRRRGPVVLTGGGLVVAAAGGVLQMVTG